MLQIYLTYHLIYLRVTGLSNVATLKITIWEFQLFRIFLLTKSEVQNLLNNSTSLLSPLILRVQRSILKRCTWKLLTFRKRKESKFKFIIFQFTIRYVQKPNDKISKNEIHQFTKIIFWIIEFEKYKIKKKFQYFFIPNFGTFSIKKKNNFLFYNTSKIWKKNFPLCPFYSHL